MSDTIPDNLITDDVVIENGRITSVAKGDPLFTKEQLRAWLAAQGFPVALGVPNGHLVRRVAIVIEESLWDLGPAVSIECFVCDEEGRRHLLPRSEAQIDANVAGLLATGSTQLRMNRGWRGP